MWPLVQIPVQLVCNNNHDRDVVIQVWDSKAVRAAPPCSGNCPLLLFLWS